MTCVPGAVALGLAASTRSRPVGSRSGTGGGLPCGDHAARSARWWRSAFGAVYGAASCERRSRICWSGGCFGVEADDEPVVAAMLTCLTCRLPVTVG